MADDDATEIAALFLEHALLVQARAVRGEGVRTDGDASLAVGARAFAEHAFIRGAIAGSVAHLITFARIPVSPIPTVMSRTKRSVIAPAGRPRK